MRLRKWDPLSDNKNWNKKEKATGKIYPLRACVLLLLFYLCVWMLHWRRRYIHLLIYLLFLYSFNNCMQVPLWQFLLFFTLVFFWHIRLIYLFIGSFTNLREFELLKTILVKPLYSKIILLFIERILKLAFDFLKFSRSFTLLILILYF